MNVFLRIKKSDFYHFLGSYFQSPLLLKLYSYSNPTTLLTNLNCIQRLVLFVVFNFAKKKTTYCRSVSCLPPVRFCFFSNILLNAVFLSSLFGYCCTRISRREVCNFQDRHVYKCLESAHKPCPRGKQKVQYNGTDNTSGISMYLEFRNDVKYTRLICQKLYDTLSLWSTCLHLTWYLTAQHIRIAF